MTIRFLDKNFGILRTFVIPKRDFSSGFRTHKTITSDLYNSNTKPTLPNNPFIRSDKMSR